MLRKLYTCFFFFNDTATTEIYTLSLHDALPICARRVGLDEGHDIGFVARMQAAQGFHRSEEHTSELQSRLHLVCRLLLEKKKYTLSLGTLRLEAYYRHTFHPSQVQLRFSTASAF